MKRSRSERGQAETRLHPQTSAHATPKPKPNPRIRVARDRPHPPGLGAAAHTRATRESRCAATRLVDRDCELGSRVVNQLQPPTATEQTARRCCSQNAETRPGPRLGWIAEASVQHSITGQHPNAQRPAPNPRATPPAASLGVSRCRACRLAITQRYPDRAFIFRRQICRRLGAGDGRQSRRGAKPHPNHPGARHPQGRPAVHLRREWHPQDGKQERPPETHHSA